MKDVSRRDFIRYLGVGAAGLAIRPGRALGSYLGPESFDPKPFLDLLQDGYGQRWVVQERTPSW